jgi:hypothetical protein
MSDKAAGQKAPSPEGCDENWAGGYVAPQSRIDPFDALSLAQGKPFRRE